MQVTKALSTETSEDGLPKFELVDLNATPATDTKETEIEKEAEVIVEKLEQANLDPYEEGIPSESPSDSDHETKSEPKSEPSKGPKSRDPLRWFGILSPPSLRQAQSSSSKLVETAVKLSTVDAEMKGVEIEIRRARKRKVKSENMLVKEETSRGNGENRAKQEAETKPLKVNRGGGCGRVAI